MNSALNVEPDLRTADRHELSRADRSLPVSAAEGYERWAPIYDDAPNPLLAREERYLLPLLIDLGDKAILDLACGTGRWLEPAGSPWLRPASQREIAVLPRAFRRRTGRSMPEREPDDA